jgi:cytochrome c oxidase cbb3-type subunit III
MKKYSGLLFSSIFGFPVASMAQDAAHTVKSEAGQPVAIIMFVIMLVLIFAIIVLSKVVFATYDLHKEKLKKIAQNTVPFLIAGLVFFSLPAHARESQNVVSGNAALIGGLSKTSFYMMLSAIILEMIIVVFLVRTFLLFSGLKKEKKVAAAIAETKKKDAFKWLEKLNNTKSVDAETEAKINLGHDYDGIGELDNPTPPWWQWGFVISVIFAGVYLYTHHVSHSAPTQLQELAIANEKADEQQKAYLASSANKIDENTVTYLSDAADLAEGKSIFTAVCAACHRADGGGIVGPNLTDEYWLHGGGIKDIFKTIKYGVPEKGMKSWKDDYSPKKIAQLASYIHSIKGSNPPSPKEPQGEKYIEETEPAAK